MMGMHNNSGTALNDAVDRDLRVTTRPDRWPGGRCYRLSDYDTAIADATMRDLDDAERLRHIGSVVANALDALAQDCGRLRHPDARWSPDDLLETLTEAAHDI